MTRRSRPLVAKAALARLSLAALVAVAATGCTLRFRPFSTGAGPVRLGPGAAFPGLFYADTNYPNRILVDDQREPIALDPDEIVIGNWVGDEKKSIGMGFRVPGGVGASDAASRGASDYGYLMWQLHEEYGYDGLLNPWVDTSYWQIDFYVVRFDSITTRVGGVGYNFKEGAPWLLQPPPKRHFRVEGEAPAQVAQAGE